MNNHAFVSAILSRAKIATSIIWGWGGGIKVFRRYRVIFVVAKVEPEWRLPKRPSKIKVTWDRLRGRGQPGHGRTERAKWDEGINLEDINLNG